ncbi:MAG: hypothetical protein ACJ8AY_03865 [Gemmatimonadales bacterium]
MLANSVGLAIAYVAFGLVLSVLARKGWAQDWDEGLLASLLGPPLFTLIALTVLVEFVWKLVGPGNQRSRNRPAW